MNQNGRYTEEDKQATESPVDTESQRNTITEQLFMLKTDIVEVHEKFEQSNELLRQKEEENRRLREKLLSLEVTVQNLFDSTRAGGAGCCAQQCTLF